jgi:hypothetical protein
MNAANDNTLTRLQLEINRALIEHNSTDLISCIGRYMKASQMTVAQELLDQIPSVIADNHRKIVKVK